MIIEDEGPRLRIGYGADRIVIDDGPAMPRMTAEQRAESMRRMAEWFDAGHIVAPKPPCPRMAVVLQEIYRLQGGPPADVRLAGMVYARVGSSLPHRHDGPPEPVDDVHHFADVSLTIELGPPLIAEFCDFAAVPPEAQELIETDKIGARIISELWPPEAT